MTISDREPAAISAPEGDRVSRTGAAFIVAGCGALASAAFLPLVNSPSGLLKTAFVQRLGGAILVLLALAILATAWATVRGGRTGLALVIVTAVAVALVLLAGSSRALRSVYPEDSVGHVDTEVPGLVQPIGAGLWVAASGAGAALLGGALIRRRALESRGPS